MEIEGRLLSVEVSCLALQHPSGSAYPFLKIMRRSLSD
ncbi:hypothetical protein PPIS_b0151 [Pseudoalteromonas piscicida]|uniref:Uncharacterized protein n=1 Tax=Pseudoalteromonas piscicida TaxID=43662 RepID=A0ABM6NK18_PSEO7|nr:hypothetical protein PPIS_b0151 [Pseudoalteromonas piscicida]